MNAIFDFSEAVLEKRIVGDGLLKELLEQKQFGTVDDRVDTLVEGLHRRERLKRITEENNRGVPALPGGMAAGTTWPTCPVQRVTVPSMGASTLTSRSRSCAMAGRNTYLATRSNPDRSSAEIRRPA